MLSVLIPSYQEGPLLGTCIQSARMAGHVTVFEGPIGDGPPSIPQHERKYNARAGHVVYGRWESDAAKRTDMLLYAQQRHERSGRRHDPLWILWVDGDELLLWGEYLRDWLHRTEAETGAGGWAIRIVEIDGSVALMYARVVRGDLIASYIASVATVELKTGMVVSLPNVRICAAGGVPFWTDEDRKIEVNDLARLRPPLAGEPHILHRTFLRDPSRTAERQSDAEARWFEDAADEAGNRSP